MKSALQHSVELKSFDDLRDNDEARRSYVWKAHRIISDAQTAKAQGKAVDYAALEDLVIRYFNLAGEVIDDGTEML